MTRIFASRCGLSATVSLLLLAACGEDANSQSAPTDAMSEAPALRADTEPPAEIPPEPEPVFTGCAVQLSPGAARMFGVCTAGQLAAAIASPVAAPPANAIVSCAVTVNGGAPAYEGCVDLSAAGLALLSEAAR